MDKSYYGIEKVAIGSGSNERQTADIVDNMLTQAVQQRASDIHIEPLDMESRVRFRIDGLLHTVEKISASRHNSVISRIKVLCGMDIAEKRVPQDGRLEIERQGRKIDLRISTLPTIRGEKAVIRILDKEGFFLSLAQLHFSESNLRLYQDMYASAHGIILITGPTGSGKSTTLYATLSELNTQEKNIITIEDPVEYKIAGINQVAVNQKTGLTFARGLRSIVRQDPNIIMIGEIRDAETAQIAIQSALTGHLVLSTLHTASAAGAVARLLDMGIEPFLLASSIRGVVAQRLVRRICPYCVEKYEANAWEKACLHLPADEPYMLERGAGCAQCGFTGYRGRMAVQEVLSLTGKVAELVLRQADTAALQNAAKQDGFTDLRRDGAAKVLSGLTTVDELMRCVCC